MAEFSAIVLLEGWRMIAFPFLLKIPRMNPRYSSVMELVIAVTTFVDLVSAIEFAVTAANIANTAPMEFLELDSAVSVPLLDRTFHGGASDGFSARIGFLAFRGSFTVSSSRKLNELPGADIRDLEFVILDHSGTAHVDDNAAHLLARIIDRARQFDTEIVVCSINYRIQDSLFEFDVLERVPHEHIVGTEWEASELARPLL